MPIAEASLIQVEQNRLLAQRHDEASSLLELRSHGVELLLLLRQDCRICRIRLLDNIVPALYQLL